MILAKQYKNMLKKMVKILGNGELNQKVHITATVFSKSAKQKIEEAGGTAIEL